MKKYNIPQSNVIRHFDVTGKSCPAYWCGDATKNSLWKTVFWNKLSTATVVKNINKATSATSANTNNVSVKSLSGNVQVIYKGSDGLNVRETPNGKVNQIVKYGSIYTVIGITSDGNWYKLKSGLYITSNKNYVKFTSNAISTPVKPNIIYRVYSEKWFSEVKDNTDYARLENRAVKGVMIKLSNGDKILYRVHVIGKGWYGWVDGYNINDHNNGYAGDLKNNIDTIEIKCDKWDIRYKVSTTSNGTAYYSEVADGQNDYAGVFGRVIDKLMCRIV